MKRSFGPLGTLAGTLTIVVGLAGCSSTDSTQRPTGMASAASMSQDPERPGAWVYRTSNADLRQYTRFIVEPTEIYRGAEASFGSMTSSQITEIAQYLTSAMRRELSNGGYAVTSQPGPNTARIVTKLVGVEQTVPGAATVSRILPIGAVANAVQGASGGSGSFTGAVILAAEVYDSQTSELLVAAVRKYNPPVFDLEATLSTMDTARSAARQAAEDLRKGVDRVQGREAR
ncbi:DUF3313 domain-containing protein [Skermanella mucosa]|uniref:DUF3313 domain-containing protein n=1 Tax=Skermanella mucosa TaxID=1789672 RepID=UPI00192BEC97|nr:DUF3313 domain-containing protein [Skermanella mucosa]UEM19766.1 DUF3313 domain-containing protein [Skermanella mucosa]